MAGFDKEYAIELLDAERIDELFEYAMKKCDENNANVLYAIGMLYKIGKGVAESPDKAFVCFKKAAELKNTRALYKLGVCYLRGMGTEKDAKKAFECYKKAAEAEDCDALCDLGVCYDTGTGTERNVNKAFECYKKAAEGKNITAVYNLGVCYQDGQGTAVNPKRAFECYKEAAEAGNCDAMCNLAGCYAEGFGTDENPEKAFAYYKKAADAGSIQAIFNLGNCYRKGTGTEADEKKMLECYQTAAEKGAPEALYNLGACFSYGMGTKIDMVRAFKCFEDAAKLGNSMAIYRMGVCYRQGDGVEKSDIKAFECFERAAQLNNIEAIANLGYCYYCGVGIKRNVKRAFVCFNKAAEEGNLNALVNLAICYYNGEGTQKDERRAIGCFEEAASKNAASGLYNLFVCYYNGKGVKKDREKAIEYAQKAADLGLNEAMSFLQLYEKKKNNSLIARIRICLMAPEIIAAKDAEIEFLRNQLLANQKRILKDTGDIKEKLDAIDQFVRNELTDFIARERSVLVRKIEESRESIEEHIEHFRQSVLEKLVKEVKSSDDLFREHEKRLAAIFGENWKNEDRMPENAKNALVSASVMWDKCVDIRVQGFDYSGVCILATAALELITKNIFFKDFKEHFLKTNNISSPSLLTCPDTLLYFKNGKYYDAMREYEKDGHGQENRYESSFLREKNVTLGNLMYIFCKEHHKVADENLQDAFVVYKNALTKNAIEEYLKTVVKDCYKEKPLEALDSFVENCDEIRVSYRNEAAHTGKLSQNDAIKCLAAVIGMNDKLSAYKNIITIEAVLMDLFEVLM